MTSFALSLGTESRGINLIVFVPVLRPGMPCASRPSSFPYEWDQIFLVAGLAIRCRYSRSSPLVPMTECAISQNQAMGSFRRDICSGVTVNFGLAKSTHDNIASCIMLLVVDRVEYLCGGGSSSSSCEM